MSAIEVKFRIRKITTDQFATVDSVVVQEDSIKVNFGFGFGINEDHKIVGCNAKFEFSSNEVPFIILNVLCDFEIAPESWNSFINTELKSIILPVSLVTHMAVLTVGTARGVLHSKTENTKFNKYLLPTINVTESLRSDIAIALEKLT
jgi:hypothetical protein